MNRLIWNDISITMFKKFVKLPTNFRRHDKSTRCMWLSARFFACSSRTSFNCSRSTFAEWVNWTCSLIFEKNLRSKRASKTQIRKIQTILHIITYLHSMLLLNYITFEQKSTLQSNDDALNSSFELSNKQTWMHFYKWKSLKWIIGLCNFCSPIFY